MRTLVAVLAASFLGACVSHAPGTDPGDHVYGASVTKVELDNRGGGFVPPPPPGPCDPEVASYIATVATHDLAWTACDVVGTGSSATTAPRVGHRVLSASEWSSLESALAKIVVVENTGQCGADKPTYALIVSTATETIEYADDFYACQNMNKAVVDGDALDQAIIAAGALAH